MILVEARSPAEAPEWCASDEYVVITVDGTEVAWGDEYGTAHAMQEGHSLEPELAEAAEQLLEAAARLWSL